MTGTGNGNGNGNEQTISDLRAAADAVRGAGWTSREMKSSTGQLCALGALNTAISGNAYFPVFWTDLRENDLVRRIFAAGEAVAALLPDEVKPSSLFKHDVNAPLSRLVTFNDQFCTGGEDLALLFDQAREKLEAER